MTIKRGLVRHKERCPNNALLQAFVEWWSLCGPFEIVILRGTTTDALQLEEYKKGRAELKDGTWAVVNPSKVVTNARFAKDSAHGHAAAIDCHPVRAVYQNGNVRLIYLGDEKDKATKTEALRLFRIYDDIAVAHGLETGESYVGLCDRPHVCDPAWRTLPLAPGVNP